MLRSGTKLLRCAGSCIGASVCVPKTLSVLIGGGNHLTSAHNDRAAMFCPERPTRHRVLACIFCLGRMARLCTEMGSEIIPRAALAESKDWPFVRAERLATNVMSALGHKRTKRHVGMNSALPPKADIRRRVRY